jgi:hypothetical protein
VHDASPARYDAAVMPDTLTPPVRNHSMLSLLPLAILIVVAAILRVLATHNDVWLDEIISLGIANRVKSPWQIFSGVHNDNNHYLNTLYLYFMRGQSYEPAYRYLSVTFGVGLVAAGYWLLARRSRVEAMIFAGLLACSYPLIHFSSEARGYSGALLGSLLACAALTRWLAQEGMGRQSLWMGLTYGLALVLAVLSHLTACLIWFPLAGGSLLILMRRPSRMKSVLQWIDLNLLPGSVLAALYFLDLRHLTPLGGPPMTLAHGLGRLLALSLGWPAKDAATVLIVLVPLVGLTVWQLALVRKSGDPLWILLPLIYVMPLVCMLFIRPPFFSPRYFLVIVPFLYVPAAMLLARLVRARMGREALAVVLALFAAGQAYLYAQFLRVGRGQLTAGLQYMMARTPSTDLRVASNQDFRAIMELSYFAPRVLKDRELSYVTVQNQGRIPADWYILHGEGYDPPGPASLHLPEQPAWYRVAYFGASELSGQAWTIYSHQHIP